MPSSAGGVACLGGAAFCATNDDCCSGHAAEDPRGASLSGAVV